ncbi:MAG TPA: carbohydrate kinase family protein [Bryobacteraceae bacterium]|nr:carbohydrate kinase family protein [Bryobacteraceae bacterium]
MSHSASAQGFDVLGIGLNATDTLILLKEFPPYAGKVAFDREMLSPGGQVATAVVACARLGLRSRYIGTIGDDMRGDVQRESLAGTGVDTSGLIVRKACANQTAYILIDERTGERTVLWQRASCLRLQAAEIREEDIANTRLLHIDGYDTEAAGRAARIARSHGIPVSLDVDTVYPRFENVLRNVDYLVAGSAWPSKWTGEHDPFAALRSLHREYRNPVTAMTLGNRGSLAFSRGIWYYSAAFDVPCADTTGAGDVFHGAFCYAMLQKVGLAEALEFSNAAAALNCTAIGARGHVPSLAEVQKLLSDARAGKVQRRGDEDIEREAGSASAAAALRKA